jgi:signal transducer and activator of transcription 5B
MMWDKTKHLPLEQLKQVEDTYHQHFSLEVRKQLASWIEEKFSPTTPFNVDDLVHQKMAVSLASQLLTMLDARIVSMPNGADTLFMKGKLQKISAQLKQTYVSNPLGLYMTVRKCLGQEMMILQQAVSTAEGHEVSATTRGEIAALKQQVLQTGDKLDKIKNEHEKFSNEYVNFQGKCIQFEKFQQHHGDSHPDVIKFRASKESMEKRIRTTYLNLSRERQELISCEVHVFHLVKECQMKVLDKIMEWKREQQLEGNGHVISFTLDTLQEKCEGLANIIWTMRQQVKELMKLMEILVDPNNMSNMLPELMSAITEALRNLVTGTFIIEKQPPQVMRKCTNFSSTVRLLVGGELNVHMAAPTVSVSIVSESQAKLLFHSPIPTKKDYSSGNIINSNGTLELHSDTNRVAATFRNLYLLKDVKRTEKKGSERVTDEKFAILFCTEFQIGELKFRLKQMSLPVVVIVHPYQEPKALATVTWDNAFSKLVRLPFIVPDKISWAQASQALNMKWTAACGRPLTTDNLYYLACKAFRNNNLSRNPKDYNNMMLTWSLFSKEDLPDLPNHRTFFEWFHHALVLTSKHLQSLWKEGHVLGFISRQCAEDLVKEKRINGCFLLRFTDTVLGGVTICFVDGADMDRQPIVNMADPFTARDLSVRSIIDSIIDIPELTFLYPETHKYDLVKFRSSPQAQSVPVGYVGRKLQVRVSSGTDSNLFGSQESEMVPSLQSPFSMSDRDLAMDETSFADINIFDSIDVGQFDDLGDDYLPAYIIPVAR